MSNQGRDKSSDVAAAFEELLRLIDVNRSQQTAEVNDLARRLQTLMRIVVEGNGQKPLTIKVSELQSLVENIQDKLENELKRRSRDTRDSKRRLSDWMRTLTAAIISSAVTLIIAIITL